MGSVKTVVHAGSQPQGYIAPVPVKTDEIAIAQQILQAIRRSLDLQEFSALDHSRGADDCVTRADQHRGVRIDGPGSFLEFANEAIMHAAKLGLFRFAEIKVAEHAPYADGEAAHQRLLDLAEPPHELSRQTPRNAVGQQEVQVLLMGDLRDKRSNCHDLVMPSR